MAGTTAARRARDSPRPRAAPAGGTTAAQRASSSPRARTAPVAVARATATRWAQSSPFPWTSMDPATPVHATAVRRARQTQSKGGRRQPTVVRQMVKGRGSRAVRAGARQKGGYGRPPWVPLQARLAKGVPLQARLAKGVPLQARRSAKARGGGDAIPLCRRCGNACVSSFQGQVKYCWSLRAAITGLPETAAKTQLCG